MGDPSGMSPDPEGAGEASMSPEQAQQVLAQFKIPPEALPMVAAACEALMATQGAPGPQQASGAPPGQSGGLMAALSSPYRQQGPR